MRRRRGMTSLSCRAERLLTALEPDGCYAVVDPTQPDEVVFRAERKGISVGGGRFKTAAAEELARHDLISSGHNADGGRLRYRISAPGRAYLRRKRDRQDTAFQTQHQEREDTIIEVEGERASVKVDAAESPLDWLRRRKDRHGQPLVDEACYQAGERLRRDLTLAAMLPSITSRWDAVPAPARGRQGPDAALASDVAIAARQRVTVALRAIGADLADLLIDVCGFLKGLEQVERDRGWPPRSGKIIVNLALARLADHYGLERSAKGPAHSRGIRAWRAVVLDGERS